MQVKIRKLKSKIPIRIIKKISTRIEKNGKLTETIKEVSPTKGK